MPKASDSSFSKPIRIVREDGWAGSNLIPMGANQKLTLGLGVVTTLTPPTDAIAIFMVAQYNCWFTLDGTTQPSNSAWTGFVLGANNLRQERIILNTPVLIVSGTASCGFNYMWMTGV